MSLCLYELKNVSLKYGSRKGESVEVLHNLNLSIVQGEFFTVIGPSGCGKTTLLKLMSGLTSPSEGNVNFQGAKVSGPVRGIGMAFQDSLMLPWRSVIDNVLLPIEILNLPKRKYIEKAQEILELVGLVGFENKASWQLSGGMRQRASLCRAMITDPAVLLLDEPFGALDAFTREELWMVLQKLHIRTECTIVLITHQLNEAVFLSDRVIVLSSRPGTIIFERTIPLPKPRNLDVRYSQDFIQIEQSLREQIDRNEHETQND